MKKCLPSPWVSLKPNGLYLFRYNLIMVDHPFRDARARRRELWYNTTTWCILLFRNGVFLQSKCLILKIFQGQSPWPSFPHYTTATAYYHNTIGTFHSSPTLTQNCDIALLPFLLVSLLMSEFWFYEGTNSIFIMILVLSTKLQ